MAFRPWPLSVMGGLPPPPGWKPPGRATAGDVLRTAGAVASLLPGLARSALLSRWVAPVNSTTEEGLAEIGARSRRVLEGMRVDVQVEGRDRVPREGGLVLMWNQTSHLDHLILALALPRPFFTVYNNEIRRTPFYGRLLERGGHFWVDRTNEVQWRASIAAAATRIREGACVLVSPEGTRSWDGRLLRMKQGAFALARQSGRPIVCVTVLGAHERLPRGCAAVRPGPVRVTFSDPIPARADDPDLEERVVATFQRDLGQRASSAGQP